MYNYFLLERDDLQKSILACIIEHFIKYKRAVTYARILPETFGSVFFLFKTTKQVLNFWYAEEGSREVARWLGMLLALNRSCAASLNLKCAFTLWATAAKVSFFNGHVFVIFNF